MRLANVRSLHSWRRDKTLPKFLMRQPFRVMLSERTYYVKKFNAEAVAMRKHIEWLDKVVSDARVLFAANGGSIEDYVPWAAISGSGVDYVAAKLGIDHFGWYPTVRAYYNREEEKEIKLAHSIEAYCRTAATTITSTASVSGTSIWPTTGTSATINSGDTFRRMHLTTI